MLRSSFGGNVKIAEKDYQGASAGLSCKSGPGPIQKKGDFFI